MKLLKCAVLPALAGFATALLFLLIGALFLKKAEDPTQFYKIVPMIAWILGALCCGATAAFAEGKQDGGGGLFGGLVLFLLHLLCSFFPGGEKGVILALAVGAGQIAVSLLAYFLCKKKARPSRKKIQKRVKKRYGVRQTARK